MSLAANILTASDDSCSGVLSLAEAERWFSSHGYTDAGYLKSHYERFHATYNFSIDTLTATSEILDIGCHWLHQAYFFGQTGFRLTCADAPNTVRLPSVISAAKSLNIKLLSYTRLDLGQGIKDLPSDSFDLIVFGETIEHLAFNPLVLWKEIYRIMRPRARIVITTPNSLYYQSVICRLSRLMTLGEYGIPVGQIFEYGTYGHHWKEFSIHELRNYFSLLSPDFEIRRSKVVTLGSDEDREREQCEVAAKAIQPNDGLFNFPAIIKNIENTGGCPFGNQIFLDVELVRKERGIQLSPPWLVE